MIKSNIPQISPCHEVLAPFRLGTESFETLAWKVIEDAESALGRLSQEADVLYDKLLETHGKLLGLHDQKTRQANHEVYDTTSQTILSLKQLIDECTALLEGVENGTIDAEDALSNLANQIPVEEIPNDSAETLSKKKRALHELANKIAKQRGIEVGGFEYRMLLDELNESGPERTTDPRRIASGRNATKLVARTAIDAASAEYAFMVATADTHGGKSRRPGKDGKRYVGISGRKIRKR